MQRARVRTRRVATRFRTVAYRLALEVMEQRVLLAYETVDTTDDSGPGSLSAAITTANSTPGLNIIDFVLPAANSATVDYTPIYQQWTIQVSSELPTIMGEVTIDGYSQNVVTDETAANEQQSIATTGDPSGGTFTLTFEGQTTVPVDYDADAQTVADAIANLPTDDVANSSIIGAANIIATGGPLPSTVFIEFTNALATTPLGLITGDPTDLMSSGTPPEVVTAITTEGNTGNIDSTVNSLSPGFDAEPRVILEGSPDGSNEAGFPGLRITSADNNIRGLMIDGFSAGVSVQGSSAVGNVIQGNYIGQYVSYLNPILIVTGGPTSAVQGIGNGVGVDIAGATNNLVGGVNPEDHNAISGNSSEGVLLDVDADGNQVVGDVIGLLEQDSSTYYQVGNSAEGVVVKSSSNLIGGATSGSTNVISANETYGIHIVGLDALNNLVEGNYIGTDFNGTYVFGEGDPINGGSDPPQTGNMQGGVFIDDAPDNQIGAIAGSDGVGNATANVISENFGPGVLIAGANATANGVWGNIIGTDIGGTIPVSNAEQGVLVESAGNSVGGDVQGAGNLISANLIGVEILTAAAIGNLVAANVIGTDGSGAYDIGNATQGVLIDGATDNTIGGTVAAARNLISGNNVGVQIQSITATASGNLIVGNEIGTDITGTLDLGNSQQGILIDSSPTNTIGGSSSGAANLISANYWGVVITGSAATNDVVLGNLIGTDITGTLALGNETDGVLVTDSAASNTIGGLGAGSGNTIAFNVVDGVRIESDQSIGNAILSNSIFSDGALGINLVSPSDPPDEVTPNNPAGSAIGPNNLLNKPTVNSVQSTASGVNLMVTYSGAADSTYAIQLFASTTGNPSGYGEGEQYLTTTSVTTDGTGSATFTDDIPVVVPSGEVVTATATDAGGDTSEFSAWITEATGSVAFSMSSFVVSEGAGSATITVTRTGGSGGYATVGYEVANGTGVYGTDYGQPPGSTPVTPSGGQTPTAFLGTLIFDAGEFSETLTIPILDDGLPGADTTVDLSIQSPTGPVTIGSPATATLDIVNDNNLPGALQFSAANYAVNEAQGSIAITVLRGQPGPAVTVDYATGGGTAVPGVRYTPVSGTLDFAPGVTEQTFSIPIIDDPGFQGDQTVGLALSDFTGGATPGDPDTATLTIQDDLRLTDYTVTTTEDSGTGSLRSAINAANSISGAHIINFILPAQNSSLVDYNPIYQQWTIQVLSMLPPISGQVTIDGYSQDVITDEPAANEQQSISISGDPSGGYFTLTFEGQTTALIPYDADAQTVADALAILPTDDVANSSIIGAANIVATGGPLPLPVFIEFTNALATTPLGPITGDPTDLTSSGTPPEVVTSITTEGNSGDITSTANALSPGFDAQVRVILEGSPNGSNQAGFPGLTITSADNNVRGLILDGFSAGISIQGSAAVGNLIQGNYLGQYVAYLNPILVVSGGTTSAVQGIGNGVGIDIDGATNNLIGGVIAADHNAISGNSMEGVLLDLGADGNQVVGNVIGLLEQDASTYYQVGNGAEGVLIKSSSNLIGGATSGSTNVISANQTYGVHIVGLNAVRNLVEGDYIGTDANGTDQLDQQNPSQTGNLLGGIFIDNAPDNQIGAIAGSDGVGNATANVISQNFGAGVLISGANATGNGIWGNIIGTDIGGTIPVSNAVQGVLVESAGNSVGGDVQGAGNLISANLIGVEILTAAAIGNLVAANVIGTDGSGAYDIGNATQGVLIDGATDNTIGGTVAAARNLISGNNVGVQIQSITATASGNLVEGNYIGTDISGTLDLGNSQQGVLIDSSPTNTIGGSSSGAANLISANYWGVVITGSAATNEVVLGNLIGTDITGTLALGNETDGVLVTDSAASNTIGGLGAGSGNTIAFNVGDGVRIESDQSIGNAILSNSIFSDGALGINLVSPSDPPDEVTPNNPAGSAIGPNNLLNKPVVTLVQSMSGGVIVDGTYSGAADSTYTIQLFDSTAGDPSGYGEGEQYLGTTSVTTDGTGSATFADEISIVVPSSQVVTATATDVGGDTSEFSAWITEAAGSLAFSMSSFVVSEGAGNATITVTRTGGSGGYATVGYGVANGTGVYGTDYGQPPGSTPVIPSGGQTPTAFIGTLIFDVGEFSETFTIPILDDGLPGNGTTVDLSIQSPTGPVTIGSQATAILDIVNDNNLPGALQFSAANYEVNEAQGSITITVLRGQPGPAVTVNYATGGGTAVPGARYTPVSGTLDFAPGVTEQTFSIPIIDDPGFQGDQTVGLALSDFTGGATPGDPDTATLTIEDDLRLTDYTVTTTEDSGTGSLRSAINAANSISGAHIINFILPAQPSSLVDFDPIYQQWIIHVDTILPTIIGQVTIDGYSQDVITNQAAANAEQSISLSGQPTGGSFTLTFGGETTDPIAYDATAAQVGSALMNLSDIGQGNIIATGGPVNDGLVVVEFSNGLATIAVGPITGDPSGLIPFESLTPEVDTSVLTEGNSGDITSTANALSPGFDAQVRVILEGSPNGSNQAGFPGLTITSADNNVRGLILDGFSTGISIQGSAAVGNLIQGNYLGQYVAYLNPILVVSGGTTSAVQGIGNGVGIDIDGATNNLIGGVIAADHNAISGNSMEGVLLDLGADGNQVVGNVIGLLEQDASTYYQVGNGAEGVLIESSSNLIGGATSGSTNVISANQTYGVHIVGLNAVRNLVEGDYIGTDANGTDQLDQQNPSQTGNLLGGIFIDNAPDNQIGAIAGSDGVGNSTANVISQNFGAGVLIAGANATGNGVWGNIIGTDIGGTIPVSNAEQGVLVESAGNSVGGDVQGAGNLISANLIGVEILTAAAIGNLVAANVIGTDGSGAYDIGNATQGVLIDGATDNTIGGTVAAARNLISGNNVGVQIQSITATASGNLIVGNEIGTDITGTLDLGNSQQGILIDSSPTNTIGGSSSGAANLISANYWGVVITGSAATNDVVLGNLIGTDITGTLALGNETDGVLVTDSAASNTIGGLGAGSGNTIAFNVGDGVRIESDQSIGNAILSNSIFSDGALGINLVSPSDPPDEVTPNNPAGSAIGPNNLLNKPVVTLVQSMSGGVIVDGTYSGAADSTYTIQLFDSTAGDPSGYGEGEQYLGTTSVTTDGTGSATFADEISIVVPSSQVVTATATDVGGDTSEFSAWITEATGSLAFSMSSFVVSEGAGNATITVTRTGGSGGYATVGYEVANGTGVYGTDYGQPPGTTPVTPAGGQTPTAFLGTLIFDGGEFSETFTIPILDNALPGADTTVDLSIQSPTGPATIGSPATAILDIVNNNNLPGSLEFSAAAYEVNEAQGSIAITVLRAQPGPDVTVNYATGGGTATPGARYTPVSGTLVFGEGETDQTFTIPIIDDPGIQGDQTVGLSLSSPTGGATLGTPDTATLTIEDDLRLTDYTVTTTEDSGSGSLRSAITNADSTPGAHIINFVLPAEPSSLVDYNPIYQQWTIQIDSALPAITGQVTIDGYSQNVIDNETPANADQSISLSGFPTGGTFTLTFEGETTTQIPYDATAAQVGAALMNLSTIGQGNIIATGGPLNNGFVFIEFTNFLATTPVDQITGNASGLIPGQFFTPEVVTSVITEGNAGNINSTVNALSPGFDAPVRVIVEGSPDGNDQATFPGLTIESADNSVRGLIIDGFSTGISIQGSAAVGNLIQGNYIGQYVSYLNPLLTVIGGPTSTVQGVGNGVGVDIVGASNNMVGGVTPADHNAISGNALQGVVLDVGANGNQVVGDVIGLLEQDASTYYQIGNGAEGVLVESSSNLIGGASAGSTNIISANQTYGVHIVGPSALRNLVEGNYIGTDINGSYTFGQDDPGNGQNNPPQTGNMRDGVFIDNAPDNQIGAIGGSNGLGDPGGNVISENFGAGVLISGASATGNAVWGNIIGTDIGGTIPVPNAEEGVLVESARNSVGGTVEGTGNLISGNLSGVAIVGAAASDNLVADNAIGTDGAGAYDIGNATQGVEIDGASDNTIGGTVAAARNLISGNNVGVLIHNTTTTSIGNLVAGNYIGTDINGTLDLGNSQQGVLIDSSPINTIGGSSSGAGNLISANFWGIEITGSTAVSEVVQGNRIGTDITGTLALGNESDGVLITDSSARDLIGGLGVGSGNTIGFNVQDGVRIETAASIQNAILSNSIFSNGGLGIDLVPPTGSPGGPNLLLPPPVLTLVESTSSGVLINGTYSGDPDSTYTIQLFASASTAPSGIAEGQQFLGTISVTTDLTGSGTFADAIPIFVTAGHFVTGTATDAANNTSEFSASIIEYPGVLEFSMASYYVSEGAGYATITVTRTGGSGGFTTVGYEVSNGTALYLTDYNQPSGTTPVPVPVNQLPTAFVGTVVFDAGQYSQTFTIPLLDNGLPGATKTVNLALQDATGAATISSPAAATLYIVNDNLPGTFAFSMANYQVNEADGAATITVFRGNPGSPVTINYATGGGTAIPNARYIPVSGTLVFAKGVITQTFTIPIIDEPGLQGDQTVGLFLSDPTGGATLGAPSTAILTIHDDLVDRTGPTVTSIRIVKHRGGVFTKFVVAFDKPLDPTTAVNLVNYAYSVRIASPNRGFGAADNTIIPIIAAAYNSSNRTVTLTLGHSIHRSTPFLFTINESTSVRGAGVGVSDRTGNLLDGNYSGIAGTPFSATISGAGGFNAPARTASVALLKVPADQVHRDVRVVVGPRGARTTGIPARARVVDPERRSGSHHRRRAVDLRSWDIPG